MALWCRLGWALPTWSRPRCTTSTNASLNAPPQRMHHSMHHLNACIAQCTTLTNASINASPQHHQAHRLNLFKAVIVLPTQREDHPPCVQLTSLSSALTQHRNTHTQQIQHHTHSSPPITTQISQISPSASAAVPGCPSWNHASLARSLSSTSCVCCDGMSCSVGMTSMTSPSSGRACTISSAVVETWMPIDRFLVYIVSCCGHSLSQHPGSA